MEVIKTAIEGVYIIEPRLFKDARGYFLESFNQREFEEKIGKVNFVQDNESMSSYGVMRGLHFQRPPYCQAKLVRCVHGSVLDVAVDIRKGSQTYGQHVSVELTEENHRQFFIPKGFAHGFAVLSETAVFQYKCDEFYHPEADGGISILDDSLGIDWRIPTEKALLSEKDSKHTKLSDYESPFRMSVPFKVFNTGETAEELRATYNAEGTALWKAQQRMLDMLLYLDKVCKEQDIPYRLDWGNILGAVRHGGFIPWDDDVDVAMERKDWKRLCKYLVEHPHPQYVLQNHRTDKGYMGAWAVLRDLKSEYVQDSAIHNARKFKGLQVDLFPQDYGNIPFLQDIAACLQRHLVNNLIGKHDRIAGCFWIILHKMVFPFFRVLNFFFGNKKFLSYSYGTAWGRILFPREVSVPYKPISFEGHWVSGPADPEKMLEILYGDYNTIPPVEERNWHQAEYRIWD